MKEAAEEGGGPAGVVEGSWPNSDRPGPREFLFGVKGAGLEEVGLESGTANRCAMIASGWGRDHSWLEDGRFVAYHEARQPHGGGGVNGRSHCSQRLYDVMMVLYTKK